MTDTLKHSEMSILEKEKKACPICGKKFVPRGNQIYCSTKCYDVNKRRSAKKYIESKECPVCGKVFIATWAGKKTCCAVCTKKMEQKSKKKKTLAEVCAEAKKLGMHYGEYVARYGA